MKQFFTLFLCLLLAASVAGQELKPKYSSVSRKWGYVDVYGNIIIPFRYDLVGTFREGLSVVQLNDKYGYIDKQGNTVIPYKYDDAGSFSEGLAWVRLNGKYGFINKQGETVIPFHYDKAESFSEELARVQLNGKYGFINVRNDWFDTRKAGEQRLSLNTIFSVFAQNYVESRINAWRKKGAFEKTSDWQARVTESTRNRKIAELARANGISSWLNNHTSFYTGIIN